MPIFTMFRGDTEVLNATITDPGQVGSPPVNLTGKQLRFALKRRLNDPNWAALCIKSIGSGITVLSAAAGTCKVTIEPGDTKGMQDAKPVTLEWDIELTDGAVVRTVARGQMIVSPDVSSS